MVFTTTIKSLSLASLGRLSICGESLAFFEIINWWKPKGFGKRNRHQMKSILLRKIHFAIPS